MNIAILDDYDQTISKLPAWQKLSPDFKLQFFNAPVAPILLENFDVIVANRERTNLNSSFLNQLPKLKHLALTGRLSGQADVATLKSRNIATSFTEGSAASAAELTIGLMLSITKRIHDRHNAVRNGDWQIGPSHTLKGKTLGVLGLGRVGAPVAQFGNLIGMNVISWGPTEDNGRSKKLGVQRVTLAEALIQSDVLCICLRLSAQTKNLIGENELSHLKSSMSLINTSRAEIIEKNALYNELKRGRIYGAFDVFHHEPLSKIDPIRTFPNVLLSPHMGYVTTEVYDTFFNQVVDNIMAWKTGAPYQNALA